MADDAMVERPHLSIGEVLSLVQEDFPDITISKIRFLESQGLLDPERTPSGYRKFYDSDIERLQWILVQQRDHFLPLKVIRERLDEWDATGTVPAGDHQAPDVDDLPVGRADHDEGRHDRDDRPDEAEPERRTDPDPRPEPEPEPDPRHAAADLAAASAVEVTSHGSEPRPVADAEMEPAPRVPDPAPVEPAGTGDPGLRVGPTSSSLTADELAARAGVPVGVVHELEGYSLIESRRIGPETYFEPDALAVVEACRTFLDHGIEVRHLRMYKIAAEREAGVFEQLVMPLLKQRNPDARARAADTVRTLADVGERLHAALLRAALSQTLP